MWVFFLSSRLNRISMCKHWPDSDILKISPTYLEEKNFLDFSCFFTQSTHYNYVKIGSPDITFFFPFQLLKRNKNSKLIQQ